MIISPFFLDWCLSVCISASSWWRYWCLSYSPGKFILSKSPNEIPCPYCNFMGAFFQFIIDNRTCTWCKRLSIYAASYLVKPLITLSDFKCYLDVPWVCRAAITYFHTLFVDCLCYFNNRLRSYIFHYLTISSDNVALFRVIVFYCITRTRWAFESISTKSTIIEIMPICCF
jgi:hypothetical protein